MSSIRISIGRKRHHDSSLRDSSSNNSSDSEEHEFYRRPKKKRTKFPSFIASHLNNIRLWISDLPVTPFFDMALRSSVDLFENKSMMEEEDDDDDVQIIGVKTVDKSEKKDRPNPFVERLQNHRRRNVDYAEKDYYSLKAKLNGSSLDDCLPPSNRTSNYETPPSNSLFCPDLLGITHHDWDPEIAEVHPLHKPPEVKPKPTSCVSNPETDVEILLETNQKKSDPDEIEILSESPIQKNALRSVRISARPALRSSTPANSSAVARTSSRLQPSSSRSYTAHEVVRLQEKAQYQLLLEKYISGSHYHPIVKRPQRDAETQADGPKNAFESSYEKMALQQPIQSFVKKYLKPCTFSPITDSTKQSSEKNESKEVSDDDEIQIVDVKLPKYRHKYKEKANLLSSSWIDELKSAVSSQTEERIRICQEHERELEKLRRERTLERLRVTLPEPIEDEFPDLTPEMDEIVDKALTTGDPNDRICKITSDYLLRKDIETLSGLNWINDLVINSYFDLIVERSKQEGYPSVHAFNTFFYSTYKQKGYASVRRWTRKLDIFSYDLIFVPMHLGVHWALAVIDHRAKKIGYYDSMGSGEECCLDLLRDYLIFEYKDKKGKLLDSIYTGETKKNIPQQMNGSDCGMFTLKYAEYISRDAVITFSQKHMHYFRRRMVYELVTNQLL